MPEQPEIEYINGKKWFRVDEIDVESKLARVVPKGFDVYSNQIILNALKYLGANDILLEKSQRERDILTNKILYALDSLANGISSGKGSLRFNDNYQGSAFLTFEALKIFFEWKEYSSDNIISAIELAYLWLKSELYQQLAHYKSKNYDETDPIKCIFALAGYKKCYDEKIKFLQDEKFDRKLYDEIIKCVFEEQQENGIWKKYYPILVLPNDGNIYPFAIYSLDRLIDLADNAIDIFDTYSDNIKMALR